MKVRCWVCDNDMFGACSCAMSADRAARVVSLLCEIQRWFWDNAWFCTDCGDSGHNSWHSCPGRPGEGPP